MSRSAKKDTAVCTKPLKAAKNAVKGGVLLGAIGALQDIARLPIDGCRATLVALALMEVQRARDALVNAMGTAKEEEEKAKMLASEIPLGFQPFSTNHLIVGGTISAGSIMILDGWFLTVAKPKTP